MKKILLATTMLAGTAGFAAAEVAVTGYAEIGIWSDTAGDIAFHQDVEVTFKMSGTTDGGLEFGAQIDLDETDVPANGDRTGTTVYVSGAFGKLTMGDTDGAHDWAIQDAGALTSLTDDHTSHVAWYGASGLDGQGDGQIVRYENTFGAFSFAVSAEQEDNGMGLGGSVGSITGVDADDIWGIGVKYNADLGGTTLNLGLAYQSGNLDGPFTDAGVFDGGATVMDENGDVLGLSIGAELAAGFSASLSFSDFGFDNAARNDFTHTGLALNYNTGALSTHFNYGVANPEIGPDVDSWGVAVNYDLGGGAVVMAGYGSDMDGTTVGDQDQWSIGLGMSF